MSSTQLLYQSSPFQAAILFVSGPFLDQCLTKKNVFAFTYSPIIMVLHLYINQENYYIVYLEIECDIYRLINAGFHNAVLLHCCICELQHISGDRENISSYLSSIRASENMPCSWIWVHSFA